MWRGATGDGLQLEVADIGEDPLAAAGDERGDVEPQLVDEAGGEVLVEGAGAAGDRDALLPRGLPRSLERRLDPLGDEVKTVPPSISMLGRGRWQRTNVGAW